MRFLIDTNVLLAATMSDLPGHADADRLVRQLLSGDEPWCLSWVNVYEFLRVATHPRVFPHPLGLDDALSQMELLLSHPGCQILGETDRHTVHLAAAVASAGGASGNFVRDCHIAALAREHDVGIIVTADTHFRRFGRWLEVLEPGEALQRLNRSRG